MKNSFRKLGKIVVLATTFLLMYACIDSMYDTHKGIDTTLSLGGDSLTIPIGSTDTMRLASFLNTDDLTFLATMDNGGYGYTLSDSISVDDLLKNVTVDKLKFDDQTFKRSSVVSFGDISVEDFVIPAYSRKDTTKMNIPPIEVGNIVPTVAMDQDFRVHFPNYALEQSSLRLPDLNKCTRRQGLLNDVNPFDDYPGLNTDPIVFDLGQDSIDIGNLSVMINYSIDVPEGITTIHQIDLEAGGQLEIELALEGVSDALSTGIFTPNLTLDPTDLFKFGPLSTVNADGKIRFTAEDKLYAYNSPRSYAVTKTFQIDAIKNLPAASNKILTINKLVGIAGKMTAEGVVKANKMEEAKKIDLIINVKVKNVKIKNMDFDVPSFTTAVSGDAIFDINNREIAKEINTINTVYFGKDPTSPNITNLVIKLLPAGFPIMKSTKHTIDYLDITFPNEFVFSNMSGKTYHANGVTLDPKHGYRAELNLSELDLSQTSIVNQTLAWNGKISYTGNVSFGGRMNSKDINVLTDPLLSLTTESAIQVSSADVTTNRINEKFNTVQIPLAFDIDIADKAARVGTVNVKRGCFIRVSIAKPTLPLDLRGNQIKIRFSDLYEFHPSPYLTGNTLNVPNDIPDYIEVELKTLHINRDLVNGKLSVIDTVIIDGGVTLLTGTVNSNDLKKIQEKQLIFDIQTTEIAIKSTLIQLKTLEASYNEATVIEMEINDIPDEIVSLDSIIFENGAKIDLTVTISNLPNLGVNPLNANMLIQFPSMLKFAAGQVNANNEMIVNQAFVNGQLTKRVYLKGLQFDGKALDGKLKINEKINMDVKVSVVDPTINSDELNGKDIMVDAKVTLSNLAFKSVYGQFKLDLEEQLNIPNITLNNLPDVLKSDDVVIDITNPVIKLVTESNTGIPVDAVLYMTKYRKGTELVNDQLQFNFSLPRTSSPSQFIKTSYWVAPSEVGMPEGYTYIPKEVQQLFNPLPDSIKVVLEPSINNGYQHFIDLTAYYQLKVKYDIIIPFSFGKDFSVVLKDTIENINLGLGDWDMSSGRMELLGEITNSIPLNMQLDLLIMDENFNLLSTPEAIFIEAGALNGAGVNSNFTVRLTDTGNDLKTISKVIMIFKATSNSTIAGTPLKPDNFIKATLKARILGGINVELSPQCHNSHETP